MAARSETGEAGAGRKLHREVSSVGLLFVSLGSIIGSGWLFGALTSAQIAGPAAIISWVLGAIVMLVLALAHAELGSMYPVAGGSTRYPHFSFGSLAGFVIGWAVWLGAVTVAPIEVLASLQYLTHYFPFLTSTTGGVTVLTGTGIIISVILMFVFTVINLIGIRLLAESNNIIMIWKVAIPFLAVAVIMILSFNTSNFTAADGFAPFGIEGVLSALSVGGIIFAYQGFEQAIQLGAETRNPERNIPLAVIGSMAVGVVLYILLQVAFIGAIDPQEELTNGWAEISFPGEAGPFARNHYIPRQFGFINNRGVPIVSIIFSFLVGCFMFLPFPGWQQLVGFIIAATVIGYAAVPLALGAMRRQEPDHPRPFKLPAGEVLAVLAFIVANLVIYGSTWDVIW